MNKKQQDEFKVLIKEGTLEALKSGEGQNAIVDALRSKGGQNAIVDAMSSLEGQDAIKRGSLAALKSEEGQEILDNSFVDNFHDVVVPTLEHMSGDISQIKIDIAYLKESTVSKEEFTQKLRTKILAGGAQ